MRVEQTFKVWSGISPTAFCDDVIARASDVAWISDISGNAWVFQPLANLIATTNRKFWGWNMSGRETTQYTRYGEGQFCDWHMDARKKPYPEDGQWGGLARKISISVNLSDPADYEGGDFEIEETTPTPLRSDRRLQTLEGLRERGSAIVFPAHMHHRVTPVTRGMRRSLVDWFLGPPFV